jgi:hypothetical protein
VPLHTLRADVDFVWESPARRMRHRREVLGVQAEIFEGKERPEGTPGPSPARKATPE